MCVSLNRLDATIVCSTVAENSAVTMSDVGARLEVVSAVPSLQDLARRTYCMELTLAGE